MLGLRSPLVAVPPPSGFIQHDPSSGVPFFSMLVLVFSRPQPFFFSFPLRGCDLDRRTVILVSPLLIRLPTRELLCPPFLPG